MMLWLREDGEDLDVCPVCDEAAEVDVCPVCDEATEEDVCPVCDGGVGLDDCAVVMEEMLVEMPFWEILLSVVASLLSTPMMLHAPREAAKQTNRRILRFFCWSFQIETKVESIS